MNYHINGLHLFWDTLHYQPVTFFNPKYYFPAVYAIYVCFCCFFWVIFLSHILRRLLYFDLRPGPKCHSSWFTERKWHILMAVRRGNRVGGNWLTKWDKLKKSNDTLIDFTGREWPVNCIAVISAWWLLNIRFQRSSGRSSGCWTVI